MQPRFARFTTLFVAATLAGALSVPSSQAADTQSETLGDKTIDELIVELEKRGVVAAPPAQSQDETPPVSAADEGQEGEDQSETLKELIAWFERVDIYGDFRGRFEGFVYDNDTNKDLTADPGGTGDPKDRYRGRYRLRLGLKADINEYFDAAFRLSTGPDANSGNQTLGSGVDWDPDDIFVDQAYVTAKPFGDHEMPADMDGHVRLGKMPNPFLSKKGDDILIFDPDIMPEGISLSYGLSPCDCFDVNIDLAYYAIDESSGKSSDPHLLASQIDFVITPIESLGFGVSPSHYAYRRIDRDFANRGAYAASGFGSNYGGNTPFQGSNPKSHLQITDVRLWAEFNGVEPWPMMVYGNVAKNHSARNTSGFNAGKEDLGWSVGTQMGDKKKNVQLSVAYFELAANATPANFVDSDLFDGRTNGKGWHFKVARQIFKNTNLKADVFFSEPLKDDIFGPTPGGPEPFYNEAVRNHDRIRFRFDVVVKW